MSKRALVAGMLALPLLVSACGEGSLAQRDPNGYEACSLLAESKKAPDVRTKVAKGLQAGEAANKASTKAIQDTAKPLFDKDAMAALEGTSSEGKNFVVSDVKALESACEGEGFNIPDARS